MNSYQTLLPWHLHNTQAAVNFLKNSSTFKTITTIMALYSGFFQDNLGKLVLTKTFAHSIRSPDPYG